MLCIVSSAAITGHDVLMLLNSAGIYPMEPYCPDSVEKMRLRWAIWALQHRGGTVEAETWPSSSSLMDFRHQRQTCSWLSDKLIRAPRFVAAIYPHTHHPVIGTGTPWKTQFAISCTSEQVCIPTLNHFQRNKLYRFVAEFVCASCVLVMQAVCRILCCTRLERICSFLRG